MGSFRIVDVRLGEPVVLVVASMPTAQPSRSETVQAEAGSDEFA